MRTLWLSQAGTVILVLLGGLSSVVMAQSETQAPVEAVHATGSTSASEISAPTITTMPNGATRITVNGHWVLTMDDPRFSGTETFIHTEDHYGETVGPVFGTTRLENEGGAWLGQYRASSSPMAPRRMSGPTSARAAMRDSARPALRTPMAAA